MRDVRSSWTGGETLSASRGDGTPLALAVQRREERAFERLVKTFEKPLYNYAYRILSDPEDAREVVQDTFLRAHRALTRRYSGDQCRALALKPWLFRIARNQSYNKRRGKRFAMEEPLDEAARDERPQAGADLAILCRIEHKQELERLNRAISRLPRESRELVFLRFIEEMPYAEISKTTGAGEASLRGKVFRSLKRLRHELEKEETTHAV